MINEIDDKFKIKKFLQIFSYCFLFIYVIFVMISQVSTKYKMNLGEFNSKTDNVIKNESISKMCGVYRANKLILNYQKVDMYEQEAKDLSYLKYNLDLTDDNFAIDSTELQSMIFETILGKYNGKYSNDKSFQLYGFRKWNKEDKKIKYCIKVLNTDEYKPTESETFNSNNAKLIFSDEYIEVWERD